MIVERKLFKPDDISFQHIVMRDKEELPRGRISETDREISFAPIPNPTRNLELNDFIGDNDFATWFKQFVDSTRKYLAKGSSVEPGILITSDIDKNYYIQTQPLMGVKNTVDIDRIQAPEGHLIQVAIHGHPVSADEIYYYPFPSPNDFYHLSTKPYDISIAVDSRGINIIWKRLQFYEQLHFFTANRHHIRVADLPMQAKHFFNAIRDNGSILDDYEEIYSVRRKLSRYLAIRMGMKLTRVEFGGDFPHNWGDIDEVHNPQQVSLGKISKILEYKDVLTKSR